MTSPSSPRGSKQHQFREPFRKGMRWIKNTFHPQSDSRSSTSSKVIGDSSPALSKNPGQPDTMGVGSPPAMAGPSGPSAMDANPPSVEPNTQPTLDPGSRTHEKYKEAASTVWAGLEMALQVLEQSSDVFPPLKSAVAGLNACIHIVKAAADNREDYGELTSELKTTLHTLNQYTTEFGAMELSDNMANITSQEVGHINTKQERGNIKRILESAQDRDDVLQCYRRIESLFRRLHTNISLRILRNTNEQIEISKGFTRNQNEQHEMTLIEGMSPEEDARYNSAYSMTIKRRGCTAETREKVQQGLHEWIQNPDSAKIYWMNGMAGTGKTTIAFSLCEWLEANKQLGASFFCSRTTASCRNVARIVPTIACQLARYSPAFRSALYNVLKRDQGISKLNVIQQFEELLKAPLLEVKDTIPNGVVIVIDALDECHDDHGVRLILATLIRFAAGLPIKFFVASRPEPAIRDKMQPSSDYSPSVLRLHDIEESIVEEDIKKFLVEALDSMSPPPSDDQIQQLARQAGKLFIYAATIVRYILPDNVSVNSSARLKKILAIRCQSANNAGSVKKYRELDALYATILTAAFDESLEDEEIEAMQLVLWTAVCSEEPMSTNAMASLLDLDQQHVWSALQPLQSVLHVSEEGGLVSTLHASFPDFLLDHLRSGVFHFNQMHHNILLADRCFEVMKEQLRFNICNLESSLMFDKNVPDLDRRIAKFISSALFYACQYWSRHLRRSGASDALCSQLVDFVTRRLLFWMEVLNLQRSIRMASAALLESQQWLLENHPRADIQQYLTHAEDFVMRFATGACTLSTPHIYISALPFCPQSSSVYVHYWGYTKGLIKVKGTATKLMEQDMTRIQTWVADSRITTLAFSPDNSQIVTGTEDGNIIAWDVNTRSRFAGPFAAHTGPVKSIAFSPDGRQLVSGSDDKTIRIWDMQTGCLSAKPLKGHTGSVSFVAFSPDSTRVVSGSHDKTIRIWDVRTGDLVAGPFSEHTEKARSVLFSPDGTRIVSGSFGETVCVWDIRTGTLVAGPFEGDTVPSSVTLSPNSSRIATGSEDGTIMIWDVNSRTLVAGPFIGHTDMVRSVAFSSDSTRIVSGADDNTVRVWDVNTSHPFTGPFEGHTDLVRSVAFSPNDIHIASASDDGTICVWDICTRQLVAGPFSGHTSWVVSLAFSPKGTRIISSSDDMTIRIWDVSTGDLVTRPFEGHTSTVSSAMFSPDGTHIVSGSYDGTIRVWDVRTGNLVVRPFEGHTGFVSSVAYSPNGTRVVSGSHDGSFRIWDAHTGKLIVRSFEGHKYIKLAAFSPDGFRIISSSHDCDIQIWDSSTGEAFESFQGDADSTNFCVYSPDGTRMVSIPDSYTIRVQNMCTGHLTSRQPERHSDSIMSVAFSSDRNFIASGSNDCTIRVWDVRTGDHIAGPFEGHTGSVWAVAFSPDDTRIVSGAMDCTIRVWDVRTARLVAGPFEGHPELVRFVAFSADANHIISISEAFDIRLWDAHNGNLVAGPFTRSNNHDRPSPSTTASLQSSDSDSVDNSATSLSQEHTNSDDLVLFSPGGTHAINLSGAAPTRVCDLRTGDLVAGPFEWSIGTHTIDLLCLRSPQIITRSDEGIKVLDAHTGDLIVGPLSAYSGSIYTAMFSPDGTQIVSGSDDGSIQVWAVPSGTAARSLEPIIHLPLSIIPSSESTNTTSNHISGLADLSSDRQYDSTGTLISDWEYGDNGWITVKSMPLFYIPLKLRNYILHPFQSLAIGPQGSLYVENWDLLIGNRWSECFTS